jgi:hypothetical protein
MREVLIVKFDLDPVVAEYIDSEGVNLNTALDSLQLSPDDVVSTNLEIAEFDSLDEYGIKGRDYMVVKRISSLERYGYELEDILDEIHMDAKELKKLGVQLELLDEEEED